MLMLLALLPPDYHHYHHNKYNMQKNGDIRKSKWIKRHGSTKEILVRAILLQNSEAQN